MRRIGAGIIVARATHALKEREDEKRMLPMNYRLTWVPASRGRHLGAAGCRLRVARAGWGRRGRRGRLGVGDTSSTKTYASCAGALP